MRTTRTLVLLIVFALLLQTGSDPVGAGTMDTIQGTLVDEQGSGIA